MSELPSPHTWKAPAHDPLCQNKDRWNAGLSVGDVSGDCPGCSFIARVRADERKRLTATEDVWARLVAKDALADLRAKVEALRTNDSRLVVYNQAIADVLALIDGSSDD